jgi:hypothetical protein
MLRSVAILAWSALVARLLSTALPGSGSGIERWIRRTDLTASILAQLIVLLGSSVLVLLVVETISDRDLPFGYRLVIVPSAAVVLMLVMLASTMGLEPEASLGLGLGCLALATSGSSAALRSTPTRGQGLVLSLITLGVAMRLGTRIWSLGLAHRDAGFAARLAWLASAGHAFDAFGVALAAARLRAEQKARAGVVLLVVLAATCAIAWGALRGSFDGAPMWQVLASRAAGELSASPVAFSTAASRYAVEVLAVLLAGSVALWPGRISAGMTSAALALLARPGVDVPVSALVLAIAALSATRGAPLEPGPRTADEGQRGGAPPPRAAGAGG